MLVTNYACWNLVQLPKSTYADLSRLQQGR